MFWVPFVEDGQKQPAPRPFSMVVRTNDEYVFQVQRVPLDPSALR